MGSRNKTRHRSRLHPRLNAATVIAGVALFVALGGGAYAAQKIGSKQIKKNAIATKHIKKNAVKAPKIANKAVKRSKLADDVLDGVQGPTGPQGPAGPQGPVGPQGPPGGTGLWAVVQANSSPTLVRGEGAVSASQGSTPIAYRFQVEFNRNIRQCAYIASTAHPEPATPVTGAGFVTAAASPSNPNVVVIETRTPDNVAVARDFHLLVVC